MRAGVCVWVGSGGECLDGSRPAHIGEVVPDQGQARGEVERDDCEGDAGASLRTRVGGRRWRIQARPKMLERLLDACVHRCAALTWDNRKKGLRPFMSLRWPSRGVCTTGEHAVGAHAQVSGRGRARSLCTSHPHRFPSYPPSPLHQRRTSSSETMRNSSQGG